MCSGNQDLRSLVCIFYFYDVQFDTVCWLKYFAFNLLFFCENSICLIIKTYTDILSIITLYYTCYDVFFFMCEMLEYHSSFFFFNLLHDNTSCMLCSDSSEVLWSHFDVYYIANLIVETNHLCIC